jgi:hypothetical protein
VVGLGALESAHSALDIAPLISLRFTNYFAKRFRRAAESLKKPPQPICILLRKCSAPRLRNAARNLMGPILLKGDVR